VVSEDFSLWVVELRRFVTFCKLAPYINSLTYLFTIDGIVDLTNCLRAVGLPWQNFSKYRYEHAKMDHVSPPFGESFANGKLEL